MSFFVKNKNNKFFYYIQSYLRLLLPSSHFQKKLGKALKNIEKYDEENIKKRVEFYNTLDTQTPLPTYATDLKRLNRDRRHRTYIFDLIKYTAYFKQYLSCCYLFGDITEDLHFPSIVRCRKVKAKNNNSVLFNLDRMRHFVFVDKEPKTPFHKRKNKVVFRGNVQFVQKNRMRLLEKHIHNPLCDVGATNRDDFIKPEWRKSRMSILEQLKYKFILCLEGNDVASGLKWVLSSNSLAIMAKPTYDTWFMESTLTPNYHYVAIKDDFSDLDEKVNYYIKHQDKALEIIRNANNHVNEFRKKEQEKIISLLVLAKYFIKTNQINPNAIPNLPKWLV